MVGGGDVIKFSFVNLCQDQNYILAEAVGRVPPEVDKYSQQYNLLVIHQVCLLWHFHFHHHFHKPPTLISKAHFFIQRMSTIAAEPSDRNVIGWR